MFLNRTPAEFPLDFVCARRSNRCKNKSCEGSKYLALVPAEDNGEEDLEVSILKAVDENGEEILVTIDDDDELEAVYGALMDLIYEDEDTEEADEN